MMRVVVAVIGLWAVSVVVMLAVLHHAARIRVRNDAMSARPSPPRPSQRWRRRTQRSPMATESPCARRGATRIGLLAVTGRHDHRHAGEWFARRRSVHIEQQAVQPPAHDRRSAVLMAESIDAARVVALGSFRFPPTRRNPALGQSLNAVAGDSDSRTT